MLQAGPSQLGQSDFVGVKFQESVQLVVSNGGKGHESSTSVKAFTQFVPEFANESSESVGMFTELILNMAKTQMETLWPAIQSVLIQEDWRAIEGN